MPHAHKMVLFMKVKALLLLLSFNYQETVSIFYPNYPDYFS